MGCFGTWTWCVVMVMPQRNVNFGPLYEIRLRTAYSWCNCIHTQFDCITTGAPLADYANARSHQHIYHRICLLALQQSPLMPKPSFTATPRASFIWLIRNPEETRTKTQQVFVRDESAIWSAGTYDQTKWAPMMVNVTSLQGGKWYVAIVFLPFLYYPFFVGW